MPALTPVLQVPSSLIPPEYLQKASAVMAKFKDGNSMKDKFDIISDAVDTMAGTGASDSSTNQARGAALRELESLLHEKDPERKFAGLQRVATKEGKAVWTLEG
jgi:hypothetical protein